MKTTLLIALCLILGNTLCTAQSHFIIAGQRDSMIYSEYQGRYPWYASDQDELHQNGWGEIRLDINHNGMADINFEATYSHTSGVGLYHLDRHLSGDSSMFFYCHMAHPSDLYQNCNDSDYVPNVYDTGDTLRDDSTGLWVPYGVIFRGDMYFDGPQPCAVTCGWDTSAIISPYCFLMSVSGTDTLFGYITGEITASAIEGPTSYYLYSGVDDIKNDGPPVYPNPFNNQISIGCNTPFTYKLFDLTGKQVLSGTDERTISTGALASGAYLIEIKTAGSVYRKKVFKQ